MAVTYNTICLTQTAATVAALMDFPAPAAAAEPIRVVLDAARERFGGARRARGGNRPRGLHHARLPAPEQNIAAG